MKHIGAEILSFREQIIAHRWPVEAEPGARQGKTLPKAEYMEAQDTEAAANAKLAAAQHMSEDNDRRAAENARRTEELDELLPKARKRAAQIKSEADKEAEAKRRAADADADADADAKPTKDDGGDRRHR